MKKSLSAVAFASSLSFGASAYVDLGTSSPPTTLGPYTVQLFNMAPQASIPDLNTITGILEEPRGGQLTWIPTLNPQANVFFSFVHGHVKMLNDTN